MKKKMVSMMMAIVLLAMAGCGASKDKETEGEDQKTTIKLGVRADGIDMAESIRDSVKEKGYDLDITTFDDSIQPNVALEETGSRLISKKNWKILKTMYISRIFGMGTM